MKIRNGFVSNSSSSSFVVSKLYLSEEQIHKIIHHYEYDEDNSDSPWNIIVEPDLIMGETSMDNFDMVGFMRKIGVDIDKVKFDADNDLMY